MRIPDEVLVQLRARGLLVSEQPFVANHLAYPDGVTIGKPSSVPGNSSGSESFWGAQGIPCDAASIVLHRKAERWVVSSEDWVPGPGPGDFVHHWDTADLAIADILGFYFGDPGRMALKRRRR